MSPGMSGWALNWVLCAVVCFIFFAFLALFIWNQRLRLRVKKLKEECARQDLWTAYISHELRSPLSVALLHLSLLNTNKTLPPDARQHTQEALHAGEHLKSLVNEILDAASLRSASFVVKREFISIEHITRDVYDLFKAAANTKNLGLELRIDEDIPGELCLDGFRLKQLLINLVDNAIKYTPEGSIKISLFKERSTDGFGGFGGIDKLKILVADSGNGISKENMALIFEPFYTSPPLSDSLAQQERQSTGLGLAIVKSLAQANGWSIEVESVTRGENSVRHGTIFTLTLPLTANLTKTNIIKASQLKQGPLKTDNLTNPVNTTRSRERFPKEVELGQLGTAPCARLSILIIDDLLVNRHVLKLGLKRIVENALLDKDQKAEVPSLQPSPFRSLHVEETGSGEDAVQLLRTQHFDLVLLDWNMPGLSGAQLLNQIRDLNRPETRVAVISGQLDQYLQDICATNGVHDLLTKPIDLSSLELLINKVIHS